MKLLQRVIPFIGLALVPFAAFAHGEEEHAEEAVGDVATVDPVTVGVVIGGAVIAGALLWFFVFRKK